MSVEHEQEDFLALFHELEARCKADPILEQEWGKAQSNFLGSQGLNTHAMHRFREWFLLERVSPKLGAPPAVIWAPESPEVNSIWHRLLDSFYGIFQGIGSDDEGYPLLEDLWSGRQIRLIRKQMNMDETGVLVGRVAVGGEDHHVPFTGAAFLIAPGLADALAKDLSSIRAKQPRSRLSQEQCENLLLPYRLLEEAEPVASKDYQEQLSVLLEGQSKWTMSQVLHLIQTQGAQEALNQIAFDSELDLEGLRHCLHGLTSTPTATTKPKRNLGEDELDQAAVQNALLAFEKDQHAGKDVEESFALLEQQLGLKPGTSDPYDEIKHAEQATNATVGPAEAPGSAMWMATFLWEQEQLGNHPSRETLEQISGFLEFLRNIFGRNLEADEIHQHQILAFFCQAKSSKTLDTQLKQLEGFLLWLAQEQGAEIQLNKESKSLIQRVVRVNQGWASSPSEIGSMALVQKSKPLLVSADDADQAEVLGWPSNLDFQPQVGDALRGQWRQGKFHVAAWFPKALMPNTAITSSD